MSTNNENWREDFNSDASRDGKSFERTEKLSFNKNKSGNSTNNRYDNKKPYQDSSRRGYGDKPYGERTYRERANYNSDRRTYDKPYGDRNYGDKNRNDKPYGNRSYGDRSYGDRYRNDRPYGDYNGEKKFFNKRPSSDNRASSYGDNDYRPKRPRFTNNQLRNDRPSFKTSSASDDSQFIEVRFDNKTTTKDGIVFRKRKNSQDYDENAKYSKKKRFEYKQQSLDPTKPIRLNKFLANAGISSRREADEFIQAGVISVNGEIVSELGTKVLPTDKIMFHNQPVYIERKIYILLNKPKDYVTTAEDTHDRKTVMDLVRNACSERIYPVGRLDRNTTGILLLTNDGDLATRLTHPKYDKKKIYHVRLDKDITPDDFNTILTGVDLGDFKIKADALNFVRDDRNNELGIEIHTGQNRIVRRIFDTLGYKVLNLDRVFFSGLTKKNLPRGKYRFLTPREISMLKMGAYE